jgi:hypothetical protein
MEKGIDLFSFNIDHVIILHILRARMPPRPSWINNPYMTLVNLLYLNGLYLYINTDLQPILRINI